MRTLAFAFVVSLAADRAAAQTRNSLSLWYDRPAHEWVEALPVGNGRLGAMVFGGTANERIQFNEATVWDGEPHDYNHDGASSALDTLRALLFAGKQKQADSLASARVMSIPLRQRPYQAFGDLHLTFPASTRTLSPTTGASSISTALSSPLAFAPAARRTRAKCSPAIQLA